MSDLHWWITFYVIISLAWGVALVRVADAIDIVASLLIGFTWPITIPSRILRKLFVSKESK